MRIRLGVAGAAALVALAACTSGGDSKQDSSAPLPTTGTHAPTGLATSGSLSKKCQRLADVAQAVTDAQAELYSSPSAASLHELQSRLASLGDDVPADVRAELTELARGFASARDLLAHPTDENKAELTRVQARISTDAQTVSHYIVAQCPAK